MSEFYEGMAEVLEVDVEQITPEFELKNVDWNSLAIVSTIALADECFGVILNGRQLDLCKTIADIENLIAAKKV
ncbi:MAG: phosphopantetheine-binding protein [Methylococcaceae bacterium]